MSDDAWGVLGVDLGGTRLRVAVFDAAGEMRHKSVVPTPPDDPQALSRAMKDARAGCEGLEMRGAVV
ncbi:MAG: ROK family protein, partial [Dehalococcoidia bacterium]|nr:ROK family protein [Dehalococcoidia bacterium]